jgi:hypothetical protein
MKPANRLAPERSPGQLYLKSLSINIFRQITRRAHIATRDPCPRVGRICRPPSDRRARRRVTATLRCPLPIAVASNMGRRNTIQMEL